jgi:hypothetical protein
MLMLWECTLATVIRRLDDYYYYIKYFDNSIFTIGLLKTICGSFHRRFGTRASGESKVKPISIQAAYFPPLLAHCI